MFLRCLATANNPPKIAIPNPTNPVLVSVAPVFARRPTLAGALGVAGTSAPAGCPGVVGVGYGLLGSG